MRVKDIQEVFSWGPIPGQYFYASDFTHAFQEFEKRYPGMGWGDAIYIFNEGRMVYISDAKELSARGRKVFLHFMLDENERKNVHRRWEKAKKNLFAFHDTISQLDSMNDKEFSAMLREHQELLIEFWVAVFPPELGNYGSIEYLQEKLEPYIPEERMPEVLEVLTTPEEPSFYQEEEIALAETEDIAMHTREYAWLKNSYSGIMTLTEEFFSGRKQEIDPDVREHLHSKIADVRRRKKEIAKQYGLSDEIMRISDAICLGIIWQDRRKKDVLMDLAMKDKERIEAAHRLGISPQNLLFYDLYEIADAFDGKPLQPEERRRILGLDLTDKITIMDTQHALDEWESFHAAGANEREICGTPASRGIASGRIRVLLDPHDAFEEGDVLVAPMTSPEYVFAMRCACAIVTDTGGLTSHAAIVSRELGKPCIVGTRVATRALKNGDLVEVDAERGIVRRIE